MDRNFVVLVDANDQSFGQMDKLTAHQQGLLHRAFSVFIFNENGKLLLQRRALDKYHGGGLWTNTCCSHPQLGENLLNSAQERLFFEMGLSCKLTFSFSFIYYAEVENKLIEHEYDHVYIGYTNDDPVINPDEVCDFRWSSIDSVLSDISIYPEHYTFWFKEAFPRLISQTQFDKR